MEADSLSELVALLRKDPKNLHALLFDPDKLAGELKSRDAKALVYGIDPERFISDLVGRSGAPRICGETCGDASSCSTTCGARSCNATCQESCNDTCKSSCGHTSSVQLRPGDVIRRGGQGR
jgi:hypothetical protein